MLENKKILVIGSGGLIGSGVARSIIEQKGSVIAVDLDVNKMALRIQQGARNLDLERIHFTELDITDENQVTEFFSQGEKIDGVVNCSYPRNNQYGADFFDVSMSNFNENVSAHLGSSFLVTQQCALYFKKHKTPFSLVNIASVYGIVAPRFRMYEDVEFTMPVEYAAIKSAIIQLNKYAASYIGDSSFRVNSVSPGGVANNQPEEFVNAYASRTFSKTLLSVDEIAGTIVFLLSDLSSKINGQNIVVDDGFTL